LVAHPPTALKVRGTNHDADYVDGRQASKLDQFVVVKCSVVINNHAISIHDTTCIYDESWARAICHSSEDMPLHYLDRSRTFRRNKLRADWIFHS
jgi:hypothetical protein